MTSTSGCVSDVTVSEGTRKKASGRRPSLTELALRGGLGTLGGKGSQPGRGVLTLEARRVGSFGGKGEALGRILGGGGSGEEPFHVLPEEVT